MKKAAITGPQRAELTDAPDLAPVGDWAVVKVHVAPMCAEYKAFVSGQAQQVMGHEAAGEVVALADGAEELNGVRVGDRVVAMPLAGCGQCPLCRAGNYIHCDQAFELSGFVMPRPGSDTMAQYLLKPAWLLKPIPDGISYERAALACCALGPSFGALHHFNVGATDTVLVTGAGPVGLGAIVNARYRGARVLVVEGIPWRAQRARELGAEIVFDPREDGLADKIKAASGEPGLRGVDVAFDASGNAQAERLCVDAARKKGGVAFAGECYDPLCLQISPDMIRKGLTLFGPWHYNLNDFPAVMDVIERSSLVDRLISHVIPMSRIQEAFELSAAHETAKVMLKPWE